MIEPKRALVTGASEGIGRAFAKQLVAAGYEVTIVARNESRLKSLLAELKEGKPHSNSEAPKNHQLKVADLSQPEGIERISIELKSHHYHLLVNNAGKGLYGEFHSRAAVDLDELMYLNCNSLVKLSHAFLQLAKSGDSLINVGSVLSFLPLPSSSVYAASKAFVASFSQSLWFEQKKRDVYVMVLCPGPTASEFHTRAGGLSSKRPSAFMLQTSEEVVSIALRALIKRQKPIVIPGYKNILLTFFHRIVTGKFLVTVLGKIRG